MVRDVTVVYWFDLWSKGNSERYVYSYLFPKLCTKIERLTLHQNRSINIAPEIGRFILHQNRSINNSQKKSINIAPK